MTAEPRRLRLATFNVLHGRSLADGKVDTSRLVEACVGLDADVLCLQEIDRGQGRSHDVDQTAAVAAAMGASSWRFEPALIGEPGGTWRAAADGETVEDGAGYGVGLVSRFPVAAWHTVRLAAARVRTPVAAPGGRGRFILLRDEPRVALAAEIHGPFGALLIATTHLSFVPGWNLVQLRRLTRALARLAPMVVVAGDLNMPAPLAGLVSRWRPMASARTFPASRPAMQIDHILGHGDLPAVNAVSTRTTALSDHLALMVDLAVSGPAAQ